jgi:hypothetical protein
MVQDLLYVDTLHRRLANVYPAAFGENEVENAQRLPPGEF